MKESKKSTVYILLPLVVIIWGMIIYEIIGNGPKEKISQSRYMPQIESKKDSIEQLTYTLALDYPDPFLGKLQKPSLDKNKTQLTERKEKEVVWPEVIYSGCVQNNDKTIGYLVINREAHIVEAMAILAEMKVLGVEPDSIYLKYENEKKWIKKN